MSDQFQQKHIASETGLNIEITEKYKDMGDGTHALVVSATGGGGGGASEVTALKPQQTVSDALITSGASLSAAIDLGVYRLVGINVPATFEGATLTFQASIDGVTYVNVYDSAGTEKSVVAGVSRRILLSPGDFFGVRYLKVRSGSSVAPTNVAADRTLKLIAEG